MPELAWSEPTVDVDAERQQLGQLAEHEIAVAVVQARTRRADQRRLAPRQDRDLLRLEPAGMDDQHALVDDAELFQPLDLGHTGAGDAGIVGRITEAGVRLQQRAVFARELVEAEDQLVGCIVESAKRGAGAEPWIAGFGVALEHRLGALKRRRRSTRSSVPAGCRAPIWSDRTTSATRCSGSRSTSRLRRKPPDDNCRDR